MNAYTPSPRDIITSSSQPPSSSSSTITRYTGFERISFRKYPKTVRDYNTFFIEVYVYEPTGLHEHTGQNLYLRAIRLDFYCQEEDLFVLKLISIFQ